jgi:adenine-specific DNA-methyltransferase
MPASDRERMQLVETACVGRTLGSVARIANGMVSGLDRAFRLDDDFYRQLNEHERAATSPVLKGRAIHSLWHDPITRYAFVEHVTSERQLQDEYPLVHAHLAPFKDRLLARYDYGNEWWQWSFLRSRTLFDDYAPTLMIPCKERITNKDRLRVALADPGVYPTQDVSAIRLNEDVREHPLYIASLICSRQWFDWVCGHGLLKGGVAEFSERPLSSLPVRLIDWNDPAQVALHDRIVAEASNDRPDLGRIDDLVAQLL